jgi:indole-3-glycerol phosphate synthase
MDDSKTGPLLKESGDRTSATANILDTIVSHKKIEVQAAKAAVSESALRKSSLFARQTLSLRSSLLDGSRTGIIAEFKRKSPSKGMFNAGAIPEDITRAYAENGASGLSVLTDGHFFGGSKEDLIRARINEIPVLRKDFIIDPYQVLESKAMGADVILLIAACLTPGEVNTLAARAKELGMEVLLEIHNEEELEHICDAVDIVGVNNRDLKTFTVDINLSVRLGDKIPADKLKISESGISDVNSIFRLKEAGFQGFLIGETFMKEKDPAIAFARFVQKLKTGIT